MSKNGEIYLVKGKIIPYKLKSKIDKYGYKTVTLSNRYGKKYIGIHRVVAITYLENHGIYHKSITKMEIN